MLQPPPELPLPEPELSTGWLNGTESTFLITFGSGFSTFVLAYLLHYFPPQLSLFDLFDSSHASDSSALVADCVSDLNRYKAR